MGGQVEMSEEISQIIDFSYFIKGKGFITKKYILLEDYNQLISKFLEDLKKAGKFYSPEPSVILKLIEKWEEK